MPYQEKKRCLHPHATQTLQPLPQIGKKCAMMSHLLDNRGEECLGRTREMLASPPELVDGLLRVIVPRSGDITSGSLFP